MKFTSSKATIGARRVAFLGYSTSSTGLRQEPREVEASTLMRMLSDFSQLRSLLGGHPFIRFLSNLAKRLRPLTILWKQQAPMFSTEAIMGTAKPFLHDLSAPFFLVFPDWDIATNGSQLFHSSVMPPETALGRCWSRNILLGRSARSHSSVGCQTNVIELFQGLHKHVPC